MLARLLVKALPELIDVAWTPLVEAYPWLRFLPERERPAFLREFAETVEACATIGNNAPLAQLLYEWRATAEVCAAPSLAVALKRASKGTRVKVPRPKPVRQLGESERQRLLRVFDTVVPAIPKRPLAEVQAELREVRAARRRAGSRLPR